MFPLKDNIPNRRLPVITIALIAANVIVYLIEIRHGGSFFGGPTDTVAVHYGAIPYEFTHYGKLCDLGTNQLGAQTVLCQGQPGVTGMPQARPATWLTAFTSMFLHGSFLHIAGNMLFLAIFGPNVEDRLGPLRYLAFYILGGLVALGAQIAVGPNSTAPTLGASGAIAAVLGGYILLYPRARILTLVFIFIFGTLIELPAYVLLGFWFLEQVAFGAAGATNPVGSSGGVAYFAHVGGFLFGLLVVRTFARGLRPPPPAPAQLHPGY